MYILFVILISASSVHGVVQSNLEKLHNNLTSGYNKDVLPMLNQNVPPQVSVQFFLGSIKGFVEKDAHFSVTGTLLASWNDDRITWDPADYGNIHTIILPVSKVWVPPIQLVNAYNDYGEIERDWMKVLYYGPHASWFPTLQFDVSCGADVTFYPFDSHTCLLGLTTNTYTSSEINITLASSKLFLDYFRESLLWEYDEENSGATVEHMPHDVTMILIFISFRRRPAFYITNLIVPTCLIGMLNNMVFILPAEAGERVGFSVTVLLAMAVFQTIVSDSLPTAALPSIPRLCYFLLADLIMGTLITVCTMFVLRVYFRKETERVPGCLQTFVSCVLCKRNKKQVNKEETCVRADITWQDVGQTLDVILFIFFFIAILSKNCLLLLMMTNNGKQVDVSTSSF